MSYCMGRRTGKNDAQLDPVRRLLLRLMAEGRTNLRTASLAIERNASYLHQLIHRGTPRVLAEDDREALAEHLGCSPDLLRHDRSSQRGTRPKPPPPGPYAAPKGYSVVSEIDVRVAAGPGTCTTSRRRSRRRGCSPIPSSATSSGPSPTTCA